MLDYGSWGCRFEPRRWQTIVHFSISCTSELIQCVSYISRGHGLHIPWPPFIFYAVSTAHICRGHRPHMPCLPLTYAVVITHICRNHRPHMPWPPPTYMPRPPPTYALAIAYICRGHRPHLPWPPPTYAAVMNDANISFPTTTIGAYHNSSSYECVILHFMCNHIVACLSTDTAV